MNRLNLTNQKTKSITPSSSSVDSPNSEIKKMGPVHLNFQPIISGISEFHWCVYQSSNLLEIEVALIINNDGYFYRSENSGIDWTTKILSKNNVKFYSQIQKKVFSKMNFEISEILFFPIEGQKNSPIYFITTSEEILISFDCGMTFTIMSPTRINDYERIPQKSKLVSILPHPSKMGHILQTRSFKDCSFSNNECQDNNHLFYSTDFGKTWTKLLESLVNIIWAPDQNNPFGMICILDISTIEPHSKTEVVYSSNFFVDQILYKHKNISLIVQINQKRN